MTPEEWRNKWASRQPGQRRQQIVDAVNTTQAANAKNRKDPAAIRAKGEAARASALDRRAQIMAQVAARRGGLSQINKMGGFGPTNASQLGNANLAGPYAFTPLNAAQFGNYNFLGG